MAATHCVGCYYTISYFCMVVCMMVLSVTRSCCCFTAPSGAGPHTRVCSTQEHLCTTVRLAPHVLWHGDHVRVIIPPNSTAPRCSALLRARRHRLAGKRHNGKQCAQHATARRSAVHRSVVRRGTAGLRARRAALRRCVHGARCTVQCSQRRRCRTFPPSPYGPISTRASPRHRAPHAAAWPEHPHTQW